MINHPTWYDVDMNNTQTTADYPFIFGIPHIKLLTELYRNEQDPFVKSELRRIIWAEFVEEQIKRGERHAHGRYIPHSHRKFRSLAL
jgi:hypothetical protein